MAREEHTPIHNSGTFNFADTINRLLPRGHVVHGYSSANGTRTLMVLESVNYSDNAPLLGFGMDITAERALGRALLTYGIREREGWDYITEQQLPESTEGQQSGPFAFSKFDRIVWGGRFWLYQAKPNVIAGSEFGGGYGMDPLEVRAGDAFGAITALANTYIFRNNTAERLPVMAIE